MQFIVPDEITTECDQQWILELVKSVLYLTVLEHCCVMLARKVYYRFRYDKYVSVCIEWFT